MKSGTKSQQTPLPGIVKACRADYELRGVSFRELAATYGIPRSTLNYIAKAEKWVKFLPPGAVPQQQAYGVKEAQEVETEILARGLRRTPLPPEGVDSTDVSHGRRGRKRKYYSAEDLERAVAAPVVSRQTAAPVQLEAPPPPPEPPPEPPPPVAESPPAVAESLPPEPPEPPPPELEPQIVIPPDRPKLRTVASNPGDAKSAKGRGKDIRTADVIEFPKIKVPPPRQVGPVQLLPDKSPEEKAKLRVTLSAIRAMMAIEQVELLDRSQTMVDRYRHLVEVYLDPAKFAGTREGETEDERAERTFSLQQAALRLLAPTERDTLAGAIKQITQSTKEFFMLRRIAVGLDKVPMGAFRPGDAGDARFADGEGAPTAVDLRPMETAELRMVQSAMEMVQQHQHAQSDAPKPPPPDPIDDLMDPAPEDGR